MAVQQAHRRGGGSPGEAEINVNSKAAGVAWVVHAHGACGMCMCWYGMGSYVTDGGYITDGGYMAVT